MKIAVTLAQDKDGHWHMLADPSVPVTEQRRDFNRLKLADFVHQGTPFVRGVVLGSQGVEKQGVSKGRAFVPPPPPPPPPKVLAPEPVPPGLPRRRRRGSGGAVAE